jgi:geranylgeranyl diphosphate synthase type II
MDNDTLRRGKPTNHVVFGEATALLAGDALLTEAFNVIGKYYLETPDVGLKLVQVLATAAGVEGMVGGQAMDLAADMNLLKIETAELIHQLKTGALIRSVTEGVAVIARCSLEDATRLIQFGAHLGLAFQLKDDLLDFDPQVKDAKNVACHIGPTKTKDWLETISRRAEEQILFLGKPAHPLVQLIEYNARRTH